MATLDCVVHRALWFEGRDCFQRRMCAGNGVPPSRALVYLVCRKYCRVNVVCIAWYVVQRGEGVVPSANLPLPPGVGVFGMKTSHPPLPEGPEDISWQCGVGIGFSPV